MSPRPVPLVLFAAPARPLGARASARALARLRQWGPVPGQADLLAETQTTQTTQTEER